MTDMKRITISFPDEIDEAILGLRKSDEFARCSYSEIVRKAVRRGLELMNAQNPKAGHGENAHNSHSNADGISHQRTPDMMDTEREART